MLLESNNTVILIQQHVVVIQQHVILLLLFVVGCCFGPPVRLRSNVSGRPLETATGISNYLLDMSAEMRSHMSAASAHFDNMRSPCQREARLMTATSAHFENMRSPRQREPRSMSAGVRLQVQ